MRKMCRRMAGFLLLAVMIFGLLPMTAEAIAPENSFILVAEAGGRLVIAPEYVTYMEGQPIGEALVACGHTLEGLSSGEVYAINGVVGSFTRSDQTGSYDLAKPASEVTHYRFSENVGSSQPSEGLLKLMTAMADYLLEESDVQEAAKTAYETACSRFVGASSKEASDLADSLVDAVEEYKTVIEGNTHNVSFSGFTDAAYPGIVITVKNAYGKEWTDIDGDGMLVLPSGTYAFHIEYSGLHVEGSLTVESSDQTVSAVFPSGTWMNTDSFLVSASYGEGSEEKDGFDDDIFAHGDWDGWELTVPVKDTFVGTVYTYVEYDKTVFAEKVPSIFAVYTNTDGKQVTEELAFESKVRGATKVLARGGQGNDVIYRISTSDENGYTLSQDYTVHFARIPTLTGIEVKDQNGRAQAATEQFADDKTSYAYKILDTVTSLSFLPKPMDSSYMVAVNGQDASNAVPVDVQGEMTVEVVVSCGTYSNTYTLIIQPGKGQSASFISNADSFRVVNSEGVELPSEKETYNEAKKQWRYKYILVPGEVYSYEATKDTYYHVKDQFTLEDNFSTPIDVPTVDWLTELTLGQMRSEMNLITEFSSADHSYTVSVPDYDSIIYIWTSASSNTEVSIQYNQLFNSDWYHGKLLEKTWNELCADDANSVPKLKRVLMNRNPYGNKITVRLSQTDGGVTFYQDYEINLERVLSLQEMKVSCGEDAVTLNKEDGTQTAYDPSVYAYTVTVPMAADELTIQTKPYENSGMNLCYGETDNGYMVHVNDAESTGSAVIPLSGTLDNETVTIAVSSTNTPSTPATIYTIQVQKAAPTEVALNLSPADALLSVHEKASGNRVWPDGNTLLLSEGFAYEYTLTCSGYVGQKGTLVVTRDEEGSLVLEHNGQTLDASSGHVDLSMSLALAPANTTINPKIEAQWSDFRGSTTNNGVTDAKIPIAAENGTLYWANQLGEGIDADAVGSPIIVDGYLITYAGDTLYRVDPVTGAVVATGKMDHKSSFSITPPTYYEGMLFVALSDGSVQAFNADTLESLWLYKDTLGGQPNSPITVCDGYLYTGFWNSETGDANFVCLSVTDEDPTQPKEEKPVTWYYTKQGGYYWAGAYVGKGFVLVGTDDGYGGYTHQTSQLLLLNSKTGKLMDSWDNLNADIRSTVAYDAVTNAYYFASKGGTLYSVQVENGTLTSKWSVALDNGSESTPMSTSTPVIYNGRAYIGVSGIGQFTAYSGHNITVIDLKTKSIAYTVETQGYPQTSGLLTTAYEAENGYVYVYFFDNYTPGKLRVLRDKAGQTAPDYVTMEGSRSTAYALFTPVGDQAQYAICSPIVDEYGTVYFKNDSAHLMAFGSAITKLEVTGELEKKEYTVGEEFDPKGITVTATYANGKTRNVTAYVTASEIAEGDSTVTLTFPYVMYHNQENGTAMDSGVNTPAPHVDVKITVTAEALEPAEKMETLTVEAEQVTVQCDGGIQKEWTVYAGLYTQSGKLIKVVSVQGTGGKTVKLSLPASDEGYEVRAFVLNADSNPVMACLSSLDQ